MWNVNKEHIQRVKEELQGCHASILARYESDVKSVEDDLNEIEELERLAYAFAAKHIPEPKELIQGTPEARAVLEPGLGESVADVAANHGSRRDEIVEEGDTDAELESEDGSEPTVLELLRRPIGADRLSLWRARRSPDAGQ